MFGLRLETRKRRRREKKEATETQRSDVNIDDNIVINVQFLIVYKRSEGNGSKNLAGNVLVLSRSEK